METFKRQRQVRDEVDMYSPRSLCFFMACTGIACPVDAAGRWHWAFTEIVAQLHHGGAYLRRLRSRVATAEQELQILEARRQRPLIQRVFVSYAARCSRRSTKKVQAKALGGGDQFLFELKYLNLHQQAFTELVVDSRVYASVDKAKMQSPLVFLQVSCVSLCYYRL
jgi:hypothetical protein